MITSNAINTFHGVWHYVYENESWRNITVNSVYMITKEPCY